MGCFTKYDAEDAIQTVGHLIEMASRLTQKICEENSYPFDERLFEQTRELYYQIADCSAN